MKYTIQPQPQAFAPRSLTITFETQAELDAFGSLFNCCAVTDAIEDVGGGGDHELWEAAEKLGADIDTCDIKKALKARLS